MTAPALISCQTLNTQLALVFDRGVTASSAAGLTAVTQPTAATNALTFVGVSGNTVFLTFATPLQAGQTLAVTVAGGTTIRDADTGVDAPTVITKVSVPAFVQPTVIQAVAGKPAPNRITVYFGRPVAAASGDLAAGWTVTINGAAVTGTISAALSPNCSRLYLVLPADISYNQVVSVSYAKAGGQLYTVTSPVAATSGLVLGNPADDVVTEVNSAFASAGSLGGAGTGSTEIEDFTISALNLSPTGLPTSSYPLSTLVKEAPAISNGVVTAKLYVSLNPVDIKLVQKYGPLQVSIGGTFGVTVDNPDGVYAADSLVTITDGVVLKQVFNSGTDPYNAVVAAQDWYVVIGGAIAQALGKIRTLDQGVGVLNDSLTLI